MVLLCFLIANGRNINKHKTVAVLGSGFFCVGEWLLSQSHNYIWLNHQFSFKSLGKFYVMLQNQRVVIKKNYSNVLIAMRVEEGLLKPPNRSYFFQSKSWLLYCLLDFSQEKLPRDWQSHICRYLLPLPARSTPCWYMVGSY